jgi:hypothetical protein
MNSFERPASEPSKGEALTYIAAKLAEVMPTGRIDSEPGDFKMIEKKLLNDEITAQEAMNMVNSLIASRMDYN